MERETFDQLLFLLLPALDRDGGRELRSSGGLVDPDARLALTLRLLAGASYLDIMMLFGISRSTVYTVMHATCDSVMSCLTLHGVPFDGSNALSVLCRGFGSSRARANPLIGCVGTMHGIAIKISKSRDCFIPRNYYYRKGLYAVPFQAVVDSRYLILSLSSVVCGYTHDSL